MKFEISFFTKGNSIEGYISTIYIDAIISSFYLQWECENFSFNYDAWAIVNLVWLISLLSNRFSKPCIPTRIPNMIPVPYIQNTPLNILNMPHIKHTAYYQQYPDNDTRTVNEPHLWNLNTWALYNKCLLIIRITSIYHLPIIKNVITIKFIIWCMYMMLMITIPVECAYILNIITTIMIQYPTPLDVQKIMVTTLLSNTFMSESSFTMFWVNR